MAGHFFCELVDDLIDQYLPRVVSIRREIHSNPELGFEELETSALVQRILKELGLEVRYEQGETGVVGILHGHSSEPVIGLRADLDALPIQEETNLTFRSRNSGVMHACGHDGHMAILLGTALVLSNLRQYLGGTVKFIFQPAEELLKGAEVMIKKGVLENPAMDRVYALHLWPELPLGHIGVKRGTAMASADKFAITLKGVGGHGANPHLTRDTITAAAHCITLLQTIVSREVSPVEPAVLSIGKIQGGSAYNTIGETVAMEGTIRTVGPDTYERMPNAFRSKLDGIALSTGTHYSLKYDRLCPSLINDEQAARDVLQKSRSLFGEHRVHEVLHPSMIAEDFGRFLEEVEGCLFFLGVGESAVRPLHTSIFDFGEEAMATGIKLLVMLVLSQLNPDCSRELEN